MPSTILPAGVASRPRGARAARLDALGPNGRLRAYERGELCLADLVIWAGRYPNEPPLINGEYAWIAVGLADLD
ncbi:MAG TPA: hypothetical protein VHQ43_01205 [Solirubrobacterales bacterium]|jgi:hypothetical protein|nr:hypothetical protein [Solirubrobacterales bacterium]